MLLKQYTLEGGFMSISVLALVVDSSIRIGALLRLWRSWTITFRIQCSWLAKAFLLLTIPTLIGTIVYPQVPLMKGVQPLVIFSLVGVAGAKCLHLMKRRQGATDSQWLAALDKEAAVNFLWSPLLAWVTYMLVLWFGL